MGSKSMPGRFVRSGKRQRAKAKQVLKSRDLMKLVSVVKNPYLHTLTAKDLGLLNTLEKPSTLYETDSIKAWREAIARAFKGCAFYALEVGNGDFKAPKRGHVHAHVIADSTDGLGKTFKGTEKCKPVTDLEGLLRYLNKPPESYSLEAELDWRVSKLLSKSKRLPRLKGWLTSKKRQEVSLANTLRPFN